MSGHRQKKYKKKKIIIIINHVQSKNRARPMAARLISKLTNKSAATSGKRKSLTSDQETEFIFLFDPSEGRFNSGIQVLRSYLSYIYCKFLLKIKCCQISFSKQRNLHTDLGSLLWFLQQFKTFLCEENVNLY